MTLFFAIGIPSQFAEKLAFECYAVFDGKTREIEKHLGDDADRAIFKKLLAIHEWGEALRKNTSADVSGIRTSFLGQQSG